MMTGVLGFAEMAEQQAKDHPAILQDLRQIRIAGERAAQVTRQLLTFARRQAATRSTVDMADLIRSMPEWANQLGYRLLPAEVDLVLGESCRRCYRIPDTALAVKEARAASPAGR